MAKSKYFIASLHPDDCNEDDIEEMIEWVNLKAEEGYSLMQPVAVGGHLFLFMELKEE